MTGLIAFLIALPLFSATTYAAGSESIVHTFHAAPDGSEPKAGLIADRAGNLYGTTYDGGGAAGAGTVYEMHPPVSPGTRWTETILHSFSFRNLLGGLGPWGGLAGDKHGNLYGTTWLGGVCGICGLVFELSPPIAGGSHWKFSVIHNFNTFGSDGMNPRADLTIDSSGNLFGTTDSGGTGGCISGCGVVFELSPIGGGWTETIVHNFRSHGHGENAYGGTSAGVTVDSLGNVYGTATRDGLGLGTVFKLEHTGGQWKYSVLYKFKTASDGAFPMSDLMLDASGELFGTTNQGGTSGCYGEGCGTVFRLTPRSTGEWSHSVLYIFSGNGDGSLPAAGVIVTRLGDVYGTTQAGGVGAGCSGSGCGVAFHLTPAQNRNGWAAEFVLHTFRNNGDGYAPHGNLIFGTDGLIYGATQLGGDPACGSHGWGCGTVFSIHP